MSQDALVSHSNWLFGNAVLFAARQQERSRTGPARLKITNTQSRGIVFGEFLPPFWDKRDLRSKAGMRDLHNKQTCVDKGKSLRTAEVILGCFSLNQIQLKKVFTFLYSCLKTLQQTEQYLSFVWMRVWGGVCCVLMDFMMRWPVCRSSLDSTQLLPFTHVWNALFSYVHLSRHGT